VYVPAAVPPGIAIGIVVPPGIATSVTGTKVLIGLAFHAILYVVAPPVGEEKDNVVLPIPPQTDVAEGAVVIATCALIVIVNVDTTLTQPLAFLTVKLPVYVPEAVAAGTLIVIGLPGNATSVTATKLLVGLAFHVIL
jgi:hypothetical protein